MKVKNMLCHKKILLLKKPLFWSGLFFAVMAVMFVSSIDWKNTAQSQVANSVFGSGTPHFLAKWVVATNTPTLRIDPASAITLVGSTTQFRAYYDPDGPGGPSAEQDVTASSVWSSDNTSVATVNGSGLATSVSMGTAQISATYSGLSASASLTVTGPAFRIAPASATTLVGSTTQFRAYYDSDGLLSGPEIEVTASSNWSSSSSSVAAIDSSGLATSIAIGTTQIGASYTNPSGVTFTSTAVLRVVAFEVRPLSASIITGATTSFNSWFYNGASWSNVISSWSSASTTIATISPSSGRRTVATGKNNGTTQIKARYSSAIGSLNAAADLTVGVAGPVNGVCGPANGGTYATTPPAGDLCSNGSASSVSGSGTPTWTWTCNGSGGGTNASCSATNSGIPANTPPSASSLSISVAAGTSDNLTADCKIRDSAVFNWSFSDPDSGDSQSAFQIKVYSDGALTNLALDTNKITSSVSSYSTSTLSAGTYYWKMMVWDNHNASSSWVIAPSSFTITEQQAINFTWSPTTPIFNSTVTFTANSTIPIASYYWQFISGNPSAVYGNPATTTFSSIGSKAITLIPTTSGGKTCSISRNVVVGGGGE